MHRVIGRCLSRIAATGIAAAGIVAAGMPPAAAQMSPGGRIGGNGGSMGGPPMGVADEDTRPAADPKPEIAAKKALAAGLKSLDRARELESQAAAATNPDKRAKLLDKESDLFNKAVDQFTEALSNKSDLVEAWDGVGYVHLKLGAYREAVDDYNHALALKPDLLPAEEHRAEAYLDIDRLDEARMAYMDLYNHAPPLAQQLMDAMQTWLKAHRADARGMRPADIDAFEKWLLERDSIAKQTASLPHP